MSSFMNRIAEMDRGQLPSISINSLKNILLYVGLSDPVVNKCSFKEVGKDAIRTRL